MSKYPKIISMKTGFIVISLVCLSFLFSCSQTIPKTDGTYEGEYSGGLFGKFRIDIVADAVSGYVLDGSIGQAEVLGTFDGSEITFESDSKILSLQGKFIGEMASDGKVSGTWVMNLYTGVFSGEKL